MSAHRTANATVPAHGAVAVTKSDATVIPPTRALYVGTAGDLTVRMVDGQTVTFIGVTAGIIPIQVDQVRSATTASNILALY